ncbi:winged helix-turn-helix domain-containing protein [Grimontia marina]|uniref:Invasion protein regulator n=1 Tax=Grimontia marina TaxID=646534 RepID=A0A128FH01_9GAMM|nr:winged helix-turn-helix domain-containing protein [Grimontia marina]CZF86078.1 invasion protein regulator [Grimontia marina]
MSKSGRIFIGQFRWDRQTQYLYPQDQDGRDVIGNAKRLTNKQQALIDCLYIAAPNKVSREAITQYVWGSEHISQESLPQLINRTRQVLEDSDKTLISNVPGQGYSLNCETISVQVENMPQEAPGFAEVINETQTVDDQASINSASGRLAIVAILAVVTVINISHFIDAYQSKKRFIETRFATPYPHIEKTDDENKLIVTVESKECIYEKDIEIINCP